MNRLTRLAASLAMATSCWAQLPVDIHHVAGRASDRLKETERRLYVAQHSVLREAKAPEEIAP